MGSELRSLRRSSMDTQLHSGIAEAKFEQLWVLGFTFEGTPTIVRVRGHVDSFQSMTRGDCSTRRGSRQRALPKCPNCKNFKVASHGRSLATSRLRLVVLVTLPGCRLVCHCLATHRCPRGHSLSPKSFANYSQLVLTVLFLLVLVGGYELPC